MKHLLFILILGSSLPAIAQQRHAIGFRTGTSIHFFQRPQKKIQRTSFDQELFYRSPQAGNIVFEAGLGFSKPGLVRQPGAAVDDAPTQSAEKAQQFELYSLNAHVQLDVTCDYLKSSPIFKNMRSYIGLLISPTLTVQKEYPEYHGIQPSVMPTPERTRDVALWTGFTQSFTYDFSRRLYLMSLVQYRFNVNRLMDKHSTEPGQRIGLQIGIGYRF